ncbi:MAG: ATP-binding cassette domain-containing protein [Balneolaceae bacterium]|nr:MAG: ATP-binding cassette domain-containing protein [Balneolaceae bacterium]
MNIILKTENLSKRYGAIQALDGLSLSIPRGSVYGILGPNGSGKTTALGIILGAIRANSGSWSWFGDEPGPEHLRKVGSLLEKPNFLPYLTGERNLKIVADIRGTGYDSIEPALVKTGIYDRRKSNFHTYSLGMKQRLGLAAALLGDPEVLVLDEPTNGLDPQGIYDVRQLIMDEARCGRTVILASHILDEVEKVCTHVAVLSKGKLLAQGTTAELLKSADVIEIAADNLDKLQSVLEKNTLVKKIVRNGNILELTVDPATPMERITEPVARAGLSATHLLRRATKLESRFLDLIKGDN